jgi:beta-hydroxylase
MISCHAEDGFIYKDSPSSWNYKDEKGFKLLVLVVLTLALLVVIGVRLSVKLDVKIFLVIFVVLLIVVYKIVRKDPLHVLYIPSCLMSMFLRTDEFLDKNVYFPNYVRFEDPESFRIIKSEIDHMLKKTDNGNTLPLTKDSYGGNVSNIGRDVQVSGDKVRGWRVLNIKVGDTYTKQAIKHFPYLVSILDKVPEIKTCAISVLEPGIRIPIHVGYYKGILRYMLATHVPEDRDNVFLCVHGRKYHWTEGQGVLWDDNFPHKVYNNSDSVRIVIYMDVVRRINPHSRRHSIPDLINNWVVNKATGHEIVKNEIKKTEVQVRI